jgi:hypothetical protein
MSKLAPLRDVPGVEVVPPKRTEEALRERIMVLNEWAWENRVPWPLASGWLDNFQGHSGLSLDEERLHALFILAQFLYFSDIEIRVLLKAVYRDLFFLPLIQEVRAVNRNSRDLAVVRSGIENELRVTRFLGVGTPSESGVHLLYYFRQENSMSKDQFLDSAQIFERVRNPQQTGADSWRLRYPEVKRYVFIDDVCGSGETAVRYTEFLEDVQSKNKDARFFYYALFGTTDGLKRVREKSIFGHNSGAVFELDETYKCASPRSRYLSVVPEGISADTVRKLMEAYGKRVWSRHPLGFENSQLLLGFHHNTPDNTIPIIWMDEENGSDCVWRPAFRRYPKYAGTI